MTAPAWTPLTENRLATVLCRVACNDGLGVCMDHIRQARVALDHLASEHLLVAPKPPVAESSWSGC